MNDDNEIDAIARQMTATTARRGLRDRVVARIEARPSAHVTWRFLPVAVAGATVVLVVVGLSLLQAPDAPVAPSSAALGTGKATAALPSRDIAVTAVLPEAGPQPSAASRVAVTAHVQDDEVESELTEVRVLPPLAAATPIVLRDISEAELGIAPLAEASISIAPLVIAPITISAQYENVSPPLLKGS